MALVLLALREDIGSGDITTNSCVREDARAVGRYFARQDCVLAGLDLIPLIYELRGGVDSLELLAKDGDSVPSGTLIAEVHGRARTMLECERVSLNFLQRLSGIATLASKYANAVAGTKCRVLDTRKTTPGLRTLEKHASACGGVVNHRMGLYDAVLIKNNHIAAAGGIRAALDRVKTANVDVEIEVRTRAELEEALACGAKHVLLDNLTPAQAATEIAFIAGRAIVELSGNINLETAASYAQTGADFISAGAITHSAQAVDLNFRVELL
jgi:nicotinate-nucleotide pyrophosphorylase (carboxylating)